MDGARRRSVEVIELFDSPARAPAANVFHVAGYSSDDTLPDLVVSRSNPAHVAPTRTNSAPAGSIRHTNSVNLLKSAPSPIGKKRKIHPNTEEIIDLDSSSDEETTTILQPIQFNLDPDKHTDETAKDTQKTAPYMAERTFSAPARTSRLLTNIDTLMCDNIPLSACNSSKSRSAMARVESRTSSASTDVDLIQTDVVLPGPDTTSCKEPQTKRQASQQKRAEKERLKAVRALEKEKLLIEKRKAQSIAAVNVLKTSKKDSTPEMILDVCRSIEKTALKTHLDHFVETLGCTLNLVEMPVAGLITFRRRTTAEYDPDRGYWIPLETQKILRENQLMVVLKGAEFLKIIDEEDGLARHVDAVRAVSSAARILYLIEGLTSIVKKSQNAKNRAYQAAVRSVGTSLETSASTSRPRPVEPVVDIDEQAVEEALMDLQVIHDCKIVHSTSPADTAEQLSILTSDISTIPYKMERNSRSTVFCTEVGQVRTGSDPRDTFEKMLQAISRVTPQVARAVASKYSSIRELCKALQAGPHVLQGLSKDFNADGTVTGQVLGVATSAKIYKALMTQDQHVEA